VHNVSQSLLFRYRVLDLLRWRDRVQAVHCWELGIKAVVVLEQAQVSGTKVHLRYTWMSCVACMLLLQSIYAVSCVMVYYMISVTVAFDLDTALTERRTVFVKSSETLQSSASNFHRSLICCSRRQPKQACSQWLVCEPSWQHDMVGTGALRQGKMPSLALAQMTWWRS